MTTSVDVGVVTYETRDLTVAALTRLMQSTDDDVRLRLLVHDNASSDGTAAAIQATVPGADLEVSPVNLGFAGGMNRLLARSTAPWFLALNSDAWPDTGAISTMVRAGERERRAAAITPRLESPDGVLEHSTYPFPSLVVATMTAIGGYTTLWPQAARRLALVGAWAHDEPRAVDWAVGAAMLIRRSALADVGPFDESFFMYAEDLEWCWRAHASGWSIWFEPGAVVRHVGNASGRKSYGDTRTRAYIHNTYRFYRRTHGAASTAAYRALNVAGCSRLYLAACARRDAEARAHWASHLRAHLGRVPSADAGPPPCSDAAPG